MATEIDKTKVIWDEPEIDRSKVEWDKTVVGVNAGGASQFKGSSLDQLPIANIKSSGGYASLPTLMKAAFVDDPQTKMKVIAQELFPDMKPDDAVANMGITSDGEIIYVKQTEDGEKLYAATPRGFSFKEAGADIVGKSPTIAGATAGGVLGAMGGFGYGAAPGAAMGGAFGEAVRQQIATDVFGQPKDKERMGREMLIEGAMAGGGELLGAGLAKYLNRNAARDISRLNLSSVDDLASKANKFDVQLTPAELTNLRSLKEQQATLMNMPSSSDVIEEFLIETRIPQIRRAIDRELASISGETTPLTGNLRATKAADKAIRDIEKSAQKAARPYYNEAYRSGEYIDGYVVVNRLDDMIEDSSGVPKAKLVRLKNEIQEKAREDGGLLLKHVDNIKKNVIDVTLDNKGLKAPDKETKRAYAEIKKMMLDMADEASPVYKKARQVYGDAAQPATELRGQMTGKLADMEGESAVKASRVLFGNQSSPEAVRGAREAISKTDPDAWNAVVRSHLQETFEKMQESSVGDSLNIGGSYRKAVFGSDAKRKMLKAALSTEQYKSLSELMDVLEATGRAMKGQSITATRQQGIGEMADEAMGPIMGSVAKVTGGPNSWKEWFRQVKLGSYSNELANIITSPDAMQKLRQLKQLPPSSELRIIGIASMLGVTTPNVAGSGSVERPNPNKGM